MIVYSKRLWGFPLLCRCYGSALPRTLPFALFSCFITWLLETQASETTRRLFDHPYPYQIYAFVVGFVLIFRTNFGYQRFWEGRTRIQDMASKWGDAISMVVVFDESSANENAIKTGRVYRNQFLHHMSLLHALALQSLRGDISSESIDQSLYEIDAQTYYSPTGRKFSRQLSTIRKPGTSNILSEGAKEHTESQLGTMMNLPTDTPVWSTWDKLSGIFVMRQDEERMDKYHHCKPFPILGFLTDVEKLALKDTTERVHMVLGWIHRGLSRRTQQGGINASPPVFSRVYQVLSDGMIGYLNALKLHDTPFPFPYSQLIFLNLLVLMFTVPVVVSSKIGDNKGETPECCGTLAACMISFFIVSMYFSLNEVARELEDPFNYDPNELALVVMQRNFNNRIQALTNELSYQVEAGVLDLENGMLFNMRPEAIAADTVGRLSGVVMEQVREQVREEMQAQRDDKDQVQVEMVEPEPFPELEAEKKEM